MFGFNNKENNSNSNQEMSKTQLVAKMFELQRKLKDIEVEVEHKGYKIKVNGKQEVTSLIDLDGTERKDLMKLINKGLSQSQHETAKLMQSDGSILSSLKNLPGI